MTATALHQKCIICRKDTHVTLKLSQSWSPRSDNQSNLISRWKLLSAESLCMLFGLPVNHDFVTMFSGYHGSTRGNKVKEEPVLCNQCLGDTSDVQYIYWQLYNLEAKLSKLQRLIYERLKFSWDTTEDKPLEEDQDNHCEILQSWFKDIKSGSHLWPKGVYISKWKEGVGNAESLILNEGLSSLSNHVQTEIEVKGEPDEDYFLNDDIDDDASSFNVPIYPKKRKKQNSRVLHQYSMDSNGKYLCTEDPDICSRTYDTKKLLTNHIKNYHEGRVHICDQEGCVEKFKSELTLIHHKRRIHGLLIETTVKPRRWIVDKEELLGGGGGQQIGKAFLCTVDPAICSRMFRRLKDLNTHVQQFHEGRNFSCDEEGCLEKFKSEGRLSSHKKNAHGGLGGIKKLIKKNITKEEKMEEECKKEELAVTSKVCDICGVTVSSKNMQSHYIVNHMGFGRFKCEFCSMDFSNPDQFKTHENLHSQLSCSLPFSCVAPGCTEILTNSYDLKRHVNQNHLSSGLKCEICGIMKHNQFLLERHLRNHHRSQVVAAASSPFICDECGNSYISESSLKAHKATFHTGRQFPCVICSKVFQRSNHLTRHKRSHSTERPFKCSVCSKGFQQQANLRKHEEIHSGTKKYECHLCGKRFKQGQNLKQHLKTQAHRSTNNNS